MYMQTKTVTLIGIDSFTSKKGNNCMLIFTTEKLTPTDTHPNCVGEKALSYFVWGDLQSKVSADDIGREITIRTAFYNGSDNLEDIIK